MMLPDDQAKGRVGSPGAAAGEFGTRVEGEAGACSKTEFNIIDIFEIMHKMRMWQRVPLDLSACVSTFEGTIVLGSVVRANHS